ncbi:Uncharacterized protein YhaN [Clostridium sp. DSM 8431]|uniref:ATP-binding protein n=1 Tax=Clostridium sp. DSM 8431 TaxID=1761781 RepID=UPI0008F13918|nr:AAA family ATPase [Clostridium sp. DSM 8431]SFU50131.1 Uncharacterized protein YhaN [Clostridium sp. DSM 8431]
MIIKEIRIGNFAGIENKVLNFEEGINLIYGDNEAGKSRIETFIKAMLYGLSSKKIKGESERKRYISFNSNSAYGEMVVLFKGKEYLIKRKFGSSKKYDSSEVLDYLTGNKLDYINSEEPGKYFLGINRSTFEKTLYIGQLSVAFNKDKEEEIMDKVTALYGCGDHEVSGEKAVQKLEALKKTYVTARGAGSLDLLKKRYDSLNEERYEAEAICEKNLDWEKELIDKKESKQKLKSEIENLEVYKKYQKKIKLQKEYKEIIDYFRESEQLKNEESEITKIISKDNKVIDEEFLDNISKKNLAYLYMLDEKEEREEELNTYITALKEKNEEIEKYKFIDLFGDNLKERLLEIKYEQQNYEEKIKSAKEISSLIEEEEKELNLRKVAFNEIYENEGIFDEIKSTLDLYELKLNELKKAYSYEEFDDENEGNNEKFKMIVSALIFIFGVILFFIKSISFIFPLLIIILAIGMIVYEKMNRNRINNNNNNKSKIDELTEEIQKIEILLDNYRRKLKLSSTEELIKYIKKYIMFKVYEEKMVIKIEEKKRVLKAYNFYDIRKKYDKNNEMIKSLIRISKCRNVNEVLEAVDVYSKINSEIEVISEKIEFSKKTIGELTNSIIKKEEVLKNNLRVIGEENLDIQDIDVLINKYREIIKKRDELHANLLLVEKTYRALIKGRDIENIKEELKDVIKFDSNYNFESEEEIEKEEKKKSNELIECEKNIKDVENNINTRLIGKRSLVEITEEIENVSNKIAKYEKQVKAINLAMDILNESIDEVRKTVGPALNKGIADVFFNLTDGKYGEIKLNDNYEMMVRDESELIKGSYLSNGTFDQLYISLRIALIEILFNDEEYSMILDDAFVQYDNKRREAAIKLINNRIKGQTLIFTCHTIEEEIMLKNDIKFNYCII